MMRSRRFGVTLRGAMAPIARESSSAGAWNIVQLAFVLSGACALAYEVLWGRWLAAVLGSSATAACVVLASYMGGQAAGAALFGRGSARLAHPLRAYVAVEMAIGTSALIFPFLADLALGLAPAARVALAVSILLIPTVLLGGTVPLVLGWSERADLPAGLSLGRLYGLNTVGAALGAVVTGFALIPRLGLSTTNQLAAAGNFAIAAMILPLALRRRIAAPTGAAPPAPSATQSAAPAFPLYAAAFLSGCVSLGLEVTFIRLLRITLASTTYVFTLVIATFVAGIGIGGLLAARRSENSNTAADLAKGQIALVILLLVTWFAAPVTQRLASAFRGGFEATMLQAAATCALLLLPTTVLMGWLFPLLGRLFMQQGDRGEKVGVLYGLNTLGAVAGSVGTTIVLIPLLGSSNGYLLLTALALVSFAIYLRLAGDGVGRQVRRAGLSVAVILAGTLFLVRGWSPVYLGISSGYVLGDPDSYEESIEYFSEGRSSNVLAGHGSDGLSLLIDGKPVASTSAADRANQLLLGHLPALLATDPKSGLVVGMGTAMTLGSLGEHDLDRLVVVELERRVPEAARLFAQYNGRVLDRPELRIVFDDAYNFLHAEEARYDVITSDPIHPFVRSGSTLYSADYFGRAARRLNRGGVFAQWLPLSNMGSGDLKMIVRNFTDVYPHARVYWNGAGNAILVGRNAPWNEPAIGREAFARVSNSLDSTAIGSAEELSSLACADRGTLIRWVGDGPRSTIDLPLLEFSAPRAMQIRTLETNLATLLGWREQWAPEVGAASTREIDDALRVLTEVAPAEDAPRTLRFLQDRVRCPERIRDCRPRLATQTLRHVLFREAYQRGGQLVLRLETGTVANESSSVDVARQLLEYAHVLAAPNRAAERRAVELELERLAAISPG